MGEVVGVVSGNGVGHIFLPEAEVTVDSEPLLLLPEDTQEIRVVSIPGAAHR